jgi:monovalent cation/hydrogen antiporter
MVAVVELILGSLVLVAGLALVARKIQVPYPILLVIGGLAIGLIPGLPRIRIEPDLIFLLFLPPLLFPAALFTSWRDFRADIRPISLLAVGLVIFTTVVVGLLAHHWTGLPLAAAFVLGAIVSPPDAVAATAIAQRLRVPRRVVTILEGESLVNDATAFVCYRFAVAAVVTGVFSMTQASLRFVLVVTGGSLVGLFIGFITAWIHRRLDDPPVHTTISLLTPFAAYLLAEKIGVSGILAVVIAGLYLGWRVPETSSPQVRLQTFPVWEMVVFLLNGLLFVLIGLQLPEVTRGLAGHTVGELAWLSVRVCVAVILVRIIWVFVAAYLPRWASVNLRKHDPYPNWRNVFVVAWTGMRGVDSLAAAMAVPLVVRDGSPFPGRDLILFLTFAVIFATLVVQGLSLPSIIRWLKVVDDGISDKEERLARIKANEAALAHLDESRERIGARVHEHLRVEYEDRLRQLGCGDGSDPTPGNGRSEYRRISQEALGVERRVILQLRNERVINDEVLRRIQHDIDLAEARLRLTDHLPRSRS